MKTCFRYACRYYFPYSLIHLNIKEEFMQRTVFISHASSEGAAALHLCEYLESHGVKCWIAPRDIRPGMDWAEAILNGVDSSSAMIILASPASSTSEHVSREVSFARGNGKLIIRFVLPGSPDKFSFNEADSSSKEEIKCEGGLEAGLQRLESFLREKDLVSDNAIRKSLLFRLLLLVAGASVLTVILVLLLVMKPWAYKHEPIWPEDISFVPIPSGSFIMGSPVTEENSHSTEGPLHEVALHSFEMMSTEVTQAMWKDVTGEDMTDILKSVLEDDAYASPPVIGSDFPVCYVSWHDAVEFAEKLNSIDSLHYYRLPSESEWEYACCSGTAGLNYLQDSTGDIDALAWHFSNSGGELHRVGTKQPNAWGLFDMLGNTSEWCQDVWHDDYEEAPCDGSAWIRGVSGFRIWRGGGYINDPLLCRSSFRARRREESIQISLGFRLVRVDR